MVRKRKGNRKKLRATLTSKGQPRTRKNPYAHYQRTGGKRSGLETQNAAALAHYVGPKGFRYEREIGTVTYTDPKEHKYLPDFQISRNNIIIETKGWFKSADRRKHLLIKQQHPELDIRFVFSNANQKIGKKSKTTYAMWCELNGFKWAQGTVPESWTREEK